MESNKNVCGVHLKRWAVKILVLESGLFIFVLERKWMKCPNFIYSHPFDDEILKREPLEFLGENLV